VVQNFSKALRIGLISFKEMNPIRFSKRWIRFSKRWIRFSKSYYNPYFANLNFLKLEDLYTHETAKSMHQFAHKTYQIAIYPFLPCQYDAHTIDAPSIEQT